MKPVKVCCFCERWESGGIESCFFYVLMELVRETVCMDIVVAELAESAFTEELRQRGVRFIELSGKQQRLWKNHAKFCRLLRAEKYDVVHVNIFHGVSLYYAQLAKRMGVPVRVAHSHNTALRKSRTRPLKMLIHRAAKALYTSSATDLWACSEPAAEFLFSKRQLAVKGFQFIPNGIDVERFRFDASARESARQELGLIKKFVIGNIGRLCYQKNQEFLLEIFAEIIHCKPESCLLLVGEGEAAAVLRQKAESLGIAHAVIFYGVSSHVERLLWAMDTFVFPSRFEGLGIAVVEAQAAGLSVLCSEKVPQEAILTETVVQLPLCAGPKAWAEELLKMQTPERSSDAGLVASAGFDIRAVAAQIGRTWTRGGEIDGNPGASL